MDLYCLRLDILVSPQYSSFFEHIETRASRAAAVHATNNGDFSHLQASIQYQCRHLVYWKFESTIFETAAASETWMVHQSLKALSDWNGPYSNRNQKDTAGYLVIIVLPMPSPWSRGIVLLPPPPSCIPSSSSLYITQPSSVVRPKQALQKAGVNLPTEYFRSVIRTWARSSGVFKPRFTVVNRSHPS